MARNVLETIQGIDIFPLISLVIFFGFFILMLYWVIGLDKEYLNDNSNMPLDQDPDVSESTNTVSKREGN